MKILWSYWKPSVICRCPPAELLPQLKSVVSYSLPLDKQELSSHISLEGPGTPQCLSLLPTSCCHFLPAPACCSTCFAEPGVLLISNLKKTHSVAVRPLPGFLSVSPTTAFVYFRASSSILSLPSPIPSLLFSSACFFLPYSGISNAFFLLALLTSVPLFQSSTTLPALGDSPGASHPASF